MSLHAKNCVCRSNGLACGQYKDKEEKTPKKALKGPKNVKNENFENGILTSPSPSRHSIDITKTSLLVVPVGELPHKDKRYKLNLEW